MLSLLVLGLFTARRKTSRFVARKVVTNGDAGGDKDCSLSFRSQPNGFLSGNSNSIFCCI